MGSFNRALKRKQEVKKRKVLKKGLKQVLNATSGIPTSCTLCGEDFNKESNPDEWFVKMSDESITLTCPDCSS